MEGSIGTAGSDLIWEWWPLVRPSCKGVDDGLVGCAILPLLPLGLPAGGY